MKPFPKVNLKGPDDTAGVVEYIVRERDNDIRDYNNLQNRFTAGRKVGKVPANSADVTDGDKIGDFNVDATFAYFLIDNAGTAEWRRVAVGAF